MSDMHLMVSCWRPSGLFRRPSTVTLHDYSYSMSGSLMQSIQRQVVVKIHLYCLLWPRSCGVLTFAPICHKQWSLLGFCCWWIAFEASSTRKAMDRFTISPRDIAVSSKSFLSVFMCPTSSLSSKCCLPPSDWERLCEKKRNTRGVRFAVRISICINELKILEIQTPE